MQNRNPSISLPQVFIIFILITVLLSDIFTLYITNTDITYRNIFHIYQTHLYLFILFIILDIIFLLAILYVYALKSPNELKKLSGISKRTLNNKKKESKRWFNKNNISHIPLGTLKNNKLYFGYEDTAIILAAPRRGKTTSFVHHAILNAPYSCVITSNKRDILDVKRHNSTDYIFDPQSLGTDGKATFSFNPLDYIHNYADAVSMSNIFASVFGANKTGDRWVSAAIDIVSCVLLAAKEKNDIDSVFTWVVTQSHEPLDYLQKKHSKIHNLYQGILHSPDQTRGGEFSNAKLMISCLGDPRVESWIKNDKEPLNIKKIIDSRSTLYLLTKEELRSSISVLTGIIVYVITTTAESMASKNDNGKLSKPLVIQLDEAANICKIPNLPDMYSHYGSRGIQVTTYLQSWTQGEKVWGTQGMSMLWNASTVRVYAGGIADSSFLHKLSELIGYYDYDEKSYQTYGGLHLNKKRRKYLETSDLNKIKYGEGIAFNANESPIMIKLNKRIRNRNNTFILWINYKLRIFYDKYHIHYYVNLTKSRCKSKFNKCVTKYKNTLYKKFKKEILLFNKVKRKTQKIINEIKKYETNK